MSGIDPSFFHPDLTAVGRALTDLLSETEQPALPGTVPPRGLGTEEALRIVAGFVIAVGPGLDDPTSMAHMDPPTPWPTWVSAALAASSNQNLLHEATGQAGRVLETWVVDRITPRFGMSGGHLTPGSTLANLTAIWAAREITGASTVVASDMAHLSVPKAARILGMDFHSVATTPVGALEPDDLGDLSNSVLVLTAGSTATGSIDPLSVGSDALWRHVDAAWAGPLRWSTANAHVLDGIETADSVAVSGHKWLFQPKESAAILFRDVDTAHDAISTGGAYLATPNVGVLGSHGVGAAAALAATMLSVGDDGIANLVDHCMGLADNLVERIEADPDLVHLAGNQAGLVVWCARDGRERPAGVSEATVNGESWWRCVAANPMANPDQVIS
ncbi:MAG: aspartate aminotransferase family protein [Acidimicrobiia bacterium]|nr:aspartate aminotransferase family protein [Acidimicrobiia bacterium]